MDNYCFLCDKVKDEEDVFLICNSHLTETCRDVVGLIYVGIGSFKGEGFIGDEDSVPVTDMYPNIKSFVKSIYFHLNQDREDDVDFVYGRCPVLLIYDTYEVTYSDLSLLNELFEDYKPFIVYQKNSKIDITRVKNWLVSTGSNLGTRTIVDYWKTDKDNNSVNLPLLCIKSGIC